MKIGRDPAADVDRVRAAREAIGREVDLYVDANGAYSRKQALAAWRTSLRRSTCAGSRSRFPPMIWKGCGCCAIAGPAGMDIAAGEYGYDDVLFSPHAGGRARSMCCRRTPRAAAA